MNYPTIEEARNAPLVRLARWVRHLPSPGMDAAGTDDAETARTEQAKVLDVISRRFREAGGWTPQLSKFVGWD